MFHITMKCDNAAFSDGALPNEIARILRKLADNIEANLDCSGYNDDDGKLLDGNGNAIGKWSFEGIAH